MLGSAELWEHGGEFFQSRELTGAALIHRPNAGFLLISHRILIMLIIFRGRA